MASESAVVIPAASLFVELVAADGLLVAPAVAPAVSSVVVLVATVPGEYSDASAVLPVVVRALVVLLYVTLGDLHLVALDSSFYVKG